MEIETKTGERGRTAVVLRTWDDYNYSETRRAWLRALITETALHSGGDYEVFFLVNVKNNDIRLDQDKNAYEQALREFVPEEFRDMAFLYNTRVLESWYPKVEEHGAQDQMYQALQIFSHKFPHFAHIWQLEMDLRLTSHVHTTLESTVAFTRAQPCRNLWERNGRFYIPELYNGSYEAFAAAVDADIGNTGVWGPAPTKISNHPVGTDWIYEDKVYGFADGAATPRRAAFVSMTRASGRLLRLISKVQRERGQWVVSEATLETFALLHGLKAVTVPHPIAFEDSVTTEAADADINHGPPHNKAGGRAPSMSYTTKGFTPGPWFRASYWFAADEAPNYWQQYLEGKCMPPMLLHPAKDE
ncbi:hypothetical protein DL765_010137 [Monosporascus sp. GIB2]|nr:hypothetical protein DL765_010137 [Monosporascus sp. GIB2]